MDLLAAKILKTAQSPLLGTQRPLAETDDEATLGLSLAGQLRMAIMTGELLPGTKLKLDQLRRTFGVSHSPLREALARLTAEGLVHSEGQRGYWVSSVSLGDLAEVVRLRVEFESLALREAIAKGDEAWRSGIEKAWTILHKTERTLVADERWEVLHRQFHLSLLSGCNMPLLLKFISILHDLSDRYRRLFLKDVQSDRNVSDEHSGIVNATMAGHADLAVALLRLHVERTGHNVQKYLETGEVASDD